MAVISPADEYRLDTIDAVEGVVLVGTAVHTVIKRVRELEAQESMKDKPKVDVEAVIAAFPKYLQSTIRSLTRNM